jgi:hypothetical protein
MYFHIQPPEYITKNEVQLTPGEAVASQFNEDNDYDCDELDTKTHPWPF